MRRKLKILGTGVFVGVFTFIILAMFLFMKVQVPTSSMYPTIQLNDKLFVARNTDVERGDIVVFYSEELKLILVKRLIGMPGEKVEIIEGDIFIDGVLLDEPYVIYKSYETHSFIVPEDSYLFLGDNRADSKDSRVWNEPYISKRFLLGKAVFRYYPYTRLGTIS